MTAAPEAAAVLLIPPLGRGSASWAAQIPALKEFRCVLFDPRGIGLATDARLTVQTLEEDAVAALDAADVDRAHVVGWSFGAAAAMELALEHPERVLSLCLLTPWARTDPHLATAFRMLSELVTHASPTAAEVATLWLILSPAAVNAAGARLAQDAQTAVADSGYPTPEVMADYLDSAITFDVLDRLPSLITPTLVIGGAEDVLVPVAHARATAAAIPAARLHVLDGSGASHALPLERADEVNELLRTFLLDQHAPDR
jgi:pimeloyl-ACP methyl ester carboxylesterase